MLPLADRIDCPRHMLHDVEAIEDDLLPGQRHCLERGLHIGLPHVHRDRLDPIELGRRPGVEEPL